MGFKQHFRWSVGSSMAALFLAVSPALADELQNWAFDTATSELTFSLPDTVLPEFFLLAEPLRLVLDIPETEIGNVEPEQIYGGAVKTIRVAQHAPETVRVVIELAPEIELASEQADIQFDDMNGQRHWRFRPLIADGLTTHDVEIAEARTESVSDAGDRISLSAENLLIPEENATSALLPLDPYDTALSDEVVTVPPLLAAPAGAVVNDLPTDAELPAASSEVVSVPVEGFSTATTTVTTVPELPPMAVPELEEPAVEVSVADLEMPERDQADLPTLVASPSPDVSAVDETLTAEPLPTSAPETVVTVPTVPDAAESEESVLLVEDPIPEEPSMAEPALTSELTVMTTVPDVEIPLPESPTETALAPVSIPPSEYQAGTGSETSSPATVQTIQQPAGARTIVQTRSPVPLVFGQPLPNAPN